ncbi:hypothetical protein NO1_0034 [Candidatus Termititenax aidoneus]|uniref:Lipoprotein n=1 Tax=Termititenax aidoneus TaxID=2218524 RepID=A0A388T8K0_TERA1|nr:hypothetical protein NO1_0034 [Candidatus Termititenax aidoneus]
MKTKKYILGIILAALILGGCGTTVGDTLGDPPPNPKAQAQETTNLPVGSLISVQKNSGGLEISGAAGCAEPAVWIGVFSSETDAILGESATLSDGSFKVKINEQPETLAVRAQAANKNMSYPVYHRTTGFF